MDCREIGCEDGRWMELAQDRIKLQAFGIVAVEPLCFAARYLVNCVYQSEPRDWSALAASMSWT